MGEQRTLRSTQVAWAEKWGLQPDERGYVDPFARNLRPDVRADTIAQIRKGSGGELEDSPKRRAKMRALHSSSALAVNVFDYWAPPERLPRLAQSLDLQTTITRLRFEAKFRTALAGTPPNLDITLDLDDHSTFAIESKFGEWLAPKPRRDVRFTQKYLHRGQRYWANQGLYASEALAAAIGAGEEHFRYLDAKQLLKHALGLATQCQRRFRLGYIYYEHSGCESAVHSDELAKFAGLIATDFPFTYLTYQALFAVLQRGCERDDEAYITYLKDRYFPVLAA
jgi:hypothetical protein